MLKQKARAIALGVLLTDLALTAISLPLTWALRHGFLKSAFPSVFPLPLVPLDQYLLLLFFILPIWGLLLASAGFYRSHRTLPLGEEIWAAGKVAFGGTAILVLLIYGLRLEFVSRWFLVLFGVINFLFLMSEKVALRTASRWVRARGFNFRTALLVGTGPKVAQFADFLEGHPHWGFRVLGYLDDNGGEMRLQDRWPCLGRITDMETVLSREVIDEVIFVIEKGKLGEYEEALLVAERHGVRAHVSLDIFPHVLARPVLEELDGSPAALLHDHAVQSGAAGGQAAHRPDPRAGSLSRDAADSGPRGSGHSGHLRIPHPVPAGALWSERPAFHAAEIPHDGARLRGATLRGLTLERDDRAGLQGETGPPADPRWARPAAPFDRRAATALERDRRRHEPGRPPSPAARGGLALRVLAAPASR